MKKGRPAHTLSALMTASAVEAVQHAMFLETSTIGLRSHSVSKRALDREIVTVDVDGLSIRVKISFAAGKAVSATPEFEDIAAAAVSLGVPTKHVLEAAAAAVHNALTRPTPAE
jgi:uncharacterized protein (DUF111 family)